MIAYCFYESDSRIMQYASALTKRGDVVDVIALARPGSHKSEVIQRVNVHRIQRRAVNEGGPLSYLLRILRFLSRATVVVTSRHFKQRYQLVHVHSVPDFLVAAALPLRIMGVPVILDIHDILPEFYASKFGTRHDSKLFRLLLLTEQISAKLCSHVLIANHIWRDRLVQRSTQPAKCSVVCNYPDPEMFRSRTDHRDTGKFVAMYPGSLNWHQGVDVAIRAIAKVKDEIPEVEFRIYGEGPAKPSLQRLVAESKLERWVKINEPLPLEQIAKQMALADLAIVPKRASSVFGNEAASTKIAEFMAIGVPLVVSRTEIDRYYYDDSMVKFFESENETDLANCILALRHDPELGEKLASNASSYVRDNSWEVKQYEYLALVDSLVTKSSNLATHLRRQAS